MSRFHWRVALVGALLSVAVLSVSLQTARTTVAEETRRDSAVAGADTGSTEPGPATSQDDSAATDKAPSGKPKNSRKETAPKKKATTRKSTSQPSRSGRQGAGSGSVIGGGTAGPARSAGGSNPSGPGASPANGSSDSAPTAGSGSPAPINGKGGKATELPAPAGPDPAEVRKVMNIQDQHTPKLMDQKGVVGTSTGIDNDGNLVIRVYTNGVDKPVVPEKLGGVKVAIVESGPLNKRWQSSRLRQTRLNRATPIGVSAFVKTNTCSTGTLGCRLRDANGNIYALSNNHVFALENEAALGLPIYQPGQGDNLCRASADDVIGHLHKFIPIEFSASANNLVDAAIMSTKADLVNTSTLKDGYGVPHSKTVAAFLGQKVQKYGRTTGYRRGTVVGINATWVIGYDAGPARFVKQIDIIGENDGLIPFSAGGDSGSLIVDEQRRPVALLFAGGGFPIDVTAANPIDEVFKALAEMGLELEVDDSAATITGKAGSTKPN